MPIDKQQKPALRAVTRWFKDRLGLEKSAKDDDYQARLEQELESYRSNLNVHELPQIFHYWSNQYLVPKFLPFGFGNPQEFFCMYMKRACFDFLNDQCRFVSIGSGNCDLEVEIVERLL